MTPIIDDGRTWRERVERLVPLLLTVTLLMGGAPGHGAEIGSLETSSNEHRQRALYSAESEVMIVPMYSKTRACAHGRLRFVSRHLDEVTSYLF